MPPIIPDINPAFNFALILLAILGTTAVPIGIAWIKAQAERRTTSHQVEEIHHQTVNDHTASQNLRDQMDTIQNLVEHVLETTSRLEERNRQHDRELSRLADGQQQQTREAHDFSNRIHKRFDWFMGWAKQTFKPRNE